MIQDLVWFGVIMIKFLEVGLITPRVGLNVHILKGVVGDAVPLETIIKSIMWFPGNAGRVAPVD